MDWYHNLDWDNEIETEFLARLARSRAQRDQYLSIQISLLVYKHPLTAKKLSDLYFDTRKDDTNDGRVLSALADASLALNKCDDALRYYLQDLQFEKSHPSISGMSRYRFPLLVAMMRHRAAYADVLGTWEAFDCSAPFPVLQFEHAAARCLVLFHLGQPKQAWTYAETALRTHEGLRKGDTLYFQGSRFECSDLFIRKKVENILARRLGPLGYVAWRFGLRK